MSKALQDIQSLLRTLNPDRITGWVKTPIRFKVAMNPKGGWVNADFYSLLAESASVLGQYIQEEAEHIYKWAVRYQVNLYDLRMDWAIHERFHHFLENLKQAVEKNRPLSQIHEQYVVYEKGRRPKSKPVKKIVLSKMRSKVKAKSK